MKCYITRVGVMAAAAAMFLGSTSSAQWVRHVDPFLGTTGGGNVFPGPTLPWGFVQPGPSTGPGSSAAGYKFNKNINGFSQQRISGMGGPIYGQISLLPITGPVGDPSTLTSTGKSNEAATPGYYTVTMAPWNVKVELTASDKVGYQRQTFPAGEVSRVVLDVSHVLYGAMPVTPRVLAGAPAGTLPGPATRPAVLKGAWGTAVPVGGEVTVDIEKREVSGWMVYQGGRSTGKPWKTYFVTRFDTPFSAQGTWGDDRVPQDGVLARAGREIGAVLTFKTGQEQAVISKTAVSWRSVEQAREYLQAEAGWDLEAVRANAVRVWEAVLGKIEIEGGTADELTRFYTAVYRAHMAPNNWTGESPERYGDKTYYENHLCMWDQFRTVSPLMTLIQPKVQVEIVNSIINFHKVDGWTGDAHSAHQYEHVQNGSNADVIIADAYVKKLAGIDWDDAYAAIRKNAFEDADPKAMSRPKLGRLRLDDYRKHHYLPTDTEVAASETRIFQDVQAVSRTLEYVYNDFCVYTLAKERGTPQDVKDLESRLGWYRNLWDAGAGGFMRGKNRDGTWFSPFDPLKVETGKQFYEGHSWTWSWYVPHDAQGLIDLVGGDAAFNEKLSTACEKYYEAYNEPCMLQTYLFIHSGRPDLTQKFVHKALEHFTTAKNGLPGNDDSGTTSAWVVWTVLGLYPNAGQDFYYIGSPSFAKSTIHLAGDRKLVIIANGVSDTNIYVQSATLNGKPWDQAWLKHADIIGGAELVLEMGDKPSKWGSSIRPPSWSKRR